MNRCATCKHWDATHPNPTFTRPAPTFRICGAVPFYGDDYEPNAQAREGLACALDAERYDAQLLTRAEFGCVLWEGK